MTSERSGIYRILRLTFIYDLVQRLIGSDRGVRLFVDEYIQPFSGARILDIGAGTGLVVSRLGTVNYLGIEPNPKYVADFNRQHISESVRMIEGTTSSVTVQPRSYDIVLVLAVLHHVDDLLAKSILAFASEALAANGRIVILDPVLHEGQSFVSRQLVSRDRGKFVRQEQDYKALFAEMQMGAQFVTRTDLSRFPYSHIITTIART